jgi:hypothetical protein
MWCPLNSTTSGSIKMLFRLLFIILFSNRITHNTKGVLVFIVGKGNVNMQVATLFLFFFLAGCLSLEGFSPTISIPTRGSSPSILWAGGFGGGGAASANKVDKKSTLSSSKQMKLKPKQQWDRYIALMNYQARGRGLDEVRWYRGMDQSGLHSKQGRRIYRSIGSYATSTHC